MIRKYSILFFIALIIAGCNYENDMVVIEEQEYEECLIFDSSKYQSKYHVILIVGQSNTHSGTGLDRSIDIANERIKQLGRFGERNYKIVGAIEPLDHHTLSVEKIGFGLTFSNLFAQSYLQGNDSLYIIPCGFGGTGFKDNKWNKGDTLYEDAIERTQFILNKYPDCTLSAILWHQGEKDVGNENYELALTSFIENLRNDLGFPNVPFILGGMVPYWTQQNSSRIHQQSIIAAVKDNVPNTGYADPNVPFVIEKGDNSIDQIHFNANGQREMGRRYFNAFNCILVN